MLTVRYTAWPIQPEETDCNVGIIAELKPATLRRATFC